MVTFGELSIGDEFQFPSESCINIKISRTHRQCLTHKWKLECDPNWKVIPTKQKERGMKRFFINVVRLAFVIGIPVCWAKLHNVDMHMDDFWIGWHFAATEKTMTFHKFVGGASRVIAEAGQVVACIVGFLWVFWNENGNNWGLAPTIRRIFFQK